MKLRSGLLSEHNIIRIAVFACLILASQIAYCAPDNVIEEGFVSIGGIEQWIAIQGQDINNPAILFLHGGPAEAQSPFLKEFIPWTKSFTVINWDQRGSGKTFGKNGLSTPGMNINRMAQDAIEIAEYACKRLNKSKVILIGHSWGAILGLHVIKLRPDLFHAFVGTGFPVSWEQLLLDRERWTRRKAAEEKDEETIKMLDEVANLPVDDMKRIMASNKWRMAPSDIEYLEIQKAFVGQLPLPTEGNVADWVAGGTFTMPRLTPMIFSFDARALGLDMPIPFFVIQGQDDHTVSFDGAEAFVKEIRAPIKAFIPIEGGHFACFTNPESFVGALLRHVLPIISED
jgi:pimeloyl-ACP methyl ester carboxylesterase